ncbi:MAG TPA: aminotransferase class IV [Pseudonocardiaceae bacterium]|nr:aminotransferase class IV [Pseudonocardiaceae bacterium]
MNEQHVVRYGHFTAMQVRGGRVRGLALHLARLAAASKEMFDVDQNDDEIRDHIQRALGDTADASVRIMVCWSDDDDAPEVLTTVRPPGDMPGMQQGLLSVPYLRPLAHIKQIGGGFGQEYYGRIAKRKGYAEALLTGPDGVISEGSITNIGFFDGTTVTWPNAPALDGITMLLLEKHLPDNGIPSRRGPIHMTDVPKFKAIFVTNSRGIAPVDRIDDLAIPVDEALMKTVTGIYESITWDPIALQQTQPST